MPREARPAPEPDDVAAAPAFTLITGVSGAGRSEAAHSLEDLGYFVVDNLPPALLPKMAELASRPGGPARVAIVVDARGGVFFGELSKALEELDQERVGYRILYLDAADDDLVNRYEATRRRHPLAPADRVVEGIRKERLMMESLRGDADLLIDTSHLTPHELRERIREAFAESPPEHGLKVSLISFGFKYGAPRDADLMLDVRFLPNPYWVDELRPLTGIDEPVCAYVEGQPQYRGFVERLEALLDVILPGYIAEGKAYLTVAIGYDGREEIVNAVRALLEDEACAGGTLLGWIAAGIRLEVCWCVLSAPGLRAAEAEASAAAFLPGAARTRIEIAQFDDGLFPYQGDEVKAWLIKEGYEPLYGARPMRRTIQRAIGDPLSEEMIRGRFKESRKIRVVLRDGAPTFIEQEAMAEV